MAIYGLSGDYYCAHNPLPVTVTGMPTNEMTLQIKIGGVNMIANPPVFYSIGGNFKLDLSNWVRQFMTPLAETYSYTTTPEIEDNKYITQMEIIFTSAAMPQTVTRRFVHCALETYELTEFDENCCVRIWKGYPFSAPVEGWDERVLFIPNDDITPEVDICGCVIYDISMCKGTYIKWLNSHGYYSYWLFPPAVRVTRNGEELFRTPRNIFNTDRTSNEDTAGFKTEEVLIVRDIVEKRYWHQLASIVGSPEVYLLDPTRDPGGDTVTPADWIKIIQETPTFERDDRYKNAQFEMTFKLPNIYTQKRI